MSYFDHDDNIIQLHEQPRYLLLFKNQHGK